MIGFNFRSGQSKKQFQHASLTGSKLARHDATRHDTDGRRIKKKEAIGTCGAPRFDGVIAVACLKMRLPGLINHRNLARENGERTSPLTANDENSVTGRSACATFGKNVIFSFPLFLSSCLSTAFTTAYRRRRDTAARSEG